MSRVGSALAVSEVVDQTPDLPVDVVNGPTGVVTGAGSRVSSIVPLPSRTPVIGVASTN